MEALSAGADNRCHRLRAGTHISVLFVVCCVLCVVCCVLCSYIDVIGSSQVPLLYVHACHENEKALE
jgi:hypothetical protein